MKLPVRFVGLLLEALAFTVGPYDSKDGPYSLDNAREFFKAHRVSMKDFRFDRDEAHGR